MNNGQPFVPSMIRPWRVKAWYVAFLLCAHPQKNSQSRARSPPHVPDLPLGLGLSGCPTDRAVPLSFQSPLLTTAHPPLLIADTARRRRRSALTEGLKSLHLDEADLCPADDEATDPGLCAADIWALREHRRFRWADGQGDGTQGTPAYLGDETDLLSPPLTDDVSCHGCLSVQEEAAARHPKQKRQDAEDEGNNANSADDEPSRGKGDDDDQDCLSGQNPSRHSARHVPPSLSPGATTILFRVSLPPHTVAPWKAVVLRAGVQLRSGEFVEAVASQYSDLLRERGIAATGIAPLKFTLRPLRSPGGRPEYDCPAIDEDARVGDLGISEVALCRQSSCESTNSSSTSSFDATAVVPRPPTTHEDVERVSLLSQTAALTPPPRRELSDDNALLAVRRYCREARRYAHM